MNLQPRIVRNYLTPSGREPFEDWLQGLKDRKGRAIIRARINRLRLGNLGEAESLGEGMYELKIRFGPGYRVYFGDQDGTIVVLLCGGDKRTQRQDLKKAREYWQDLRRRSHG